MAVLQLSKRYNAKSVPGIIKRKHIPHTYWLIRDFSNCRDFGVDTNDGRITYYSSDYYYSKGQQDKDKAKGIADRFLASRGIDPAGLKKTQESNSDNYIFYDFERQRDLFGQKTALDVVDLVVGENRIKYYNEDIELWPYNGYRFDYNLYFMDKIGSVAVFVISVFAAALILMAAIVLSIVHARDINWRAGLLMALAVFCAILLELLLSRKDYFADPYYLFFKMIDLFFAPALMIFFLPTAMYYFRKEFKEDLFLLPGHGYRAGKVVLAAFSVAFFFMVLDINSVDFLSRIKVFFYLGPSWVTEKISDCRLPFIMPVIISAVAAFAEETFRAFTIGFCKRFSRSTLVAVLISAFIWGFMHTDIGDSYYPGYMIGIVRFLDGILMGYLMVYFGFETAVIVHFLWDIYLVGFQTIVFSPQSGTKVEFMFIVVILAYFYAILKGLTGRAPLVGRSPLC